jgi:hypothetical protein
MSELKISSVVGQPLREGWSHIISQPGKNLICSLGVAGKNANNIGRSLSDTVQSTQVENAKDIHHLILDLLRRTRNNGNELSLALALFGKQQVIFATYNGKILLKRQPSSQNKKYKIGPLLQSETEPKIIMGQLRPEDTLVLMTQQVTGLEAELSNLLKKKNGVDQIATKLVTIVHDQHDSSLSAIALISANPSAETKQPTKTTTKAATGKKKLQTFTNHKEQLDKAKAQTDQTDKKTQEVKPSQRKKIKINLIKLITSIVKKTGSLITKIKLPAFKFKFNSIAKSLTSNPLTQIKRKKQVYLNQGHKRKTARIVVALLITAGLIIGGINIYQQRIKARKEKINQELETAQTLLTEAKQLPEDQLIEAREKAQQAIELLTAKAKKYQQNQLALSTVKQKLAEAEKFYQSISGQNQLNQLDIFFDLREIVPNFLTTHLTANQNDLFFLDQGQQQLIQLNLTNQEAKIIDLPEEAQVIDLTANENSLYLLGQGIFHLPLNQEQAEFEQIKTEGDSDGAASLIGNFSNYLYVFNPEKRNIYRYILRDENELSEPIGWLTNKREIEFEQINDMSINGFIWLVDNQGTTTKLSKGEPATDFSISGLNQEIEENPKIATAEESDDILILDPDQERIVILNQNGEFIQQITSPSLASTKQITLIPEENMALAVSGSIVYSIPLDQD